MANAWFIREFKVEALIEKLGRGRKLIYVHLKLKIWIEISSHHNNTDENIVEQKKSSYTHVFYTILLRNKKR